MGITMSNPLFTVFTPTFNRSQVLRRTFDSLCAQTYRNFEWVIVDDGSTDDTAARVEEWRRSAPFVIRYFYQSNAGKHRAHNLAVRQASGELLAVLDSDDSLAPRAIERLVFHWLAIPEKDRGCFSGVTCLCMDERGKLVGQPFPSPILDCRHYELETVFGVAGEKWGCHRTSVLRQFEFPSFPGEIYCPEGLVWNRIARQYLVRHVNECLRIYLTKSDGVTANWPRLMTNSSRGARLYYQECLQLTAPWPWRLKRAANYVRYSLHSCVPVATLVRDTASPMPVLFATPLGSALYFMDRMSIPTERLDGAARSERAA